MGNSPSSNQSSSSSSSSLATAAATTCEDVSASTTVDDDISASHVVVKVAAAAPPTAPLSPSSTISMTSGKFNPNNHVGISIQTLGSGGGSGPNTMDLGMYTIDAFTAGSHPQTVGQTLGAALGGVGNVGSGIGNTGDALLNSLTKDMTTSILGGQMVAVGRLWPGSGRMMRSYRIRVHVPRMDSKLNASSTTTTSSLDGEIGNRANNSNAASLSPISISASSTFTIDLSCKAFIVRSELGEIQLRKVLAEGDAELKRLRSLLSDPTVHPHVLSYARWVIGQPLSPSSNYQSSPPIAAPASRPIYLLRQYAHASLSDRLVSRPFLTSIEKTWIAYQLLTAVQSLHDAGVCHGHLTTENVLLTSWNWVLISDLGCQHYKPVVLPDDDPGTWIHWFEGRGVAGNDRETAGVGGHYTGGGNGEKKCCLAPERFFTPGHAPSTTTTTTSAINNHTTQHESGKGEASISTELTPEMDVFSLGCVLIELFLNGERALDLGDLMEYRKEGRESVGTKGAPTALPQALKQKLDKIESSKMRAACRHMLSLDPSSRLKPVEYLERISSSSSTSAKKMKGGTVGNNGGNPKEEHSSRTQSSTSYAPVPQCFKSTLYPLMLRLRSQILSPDARIALVAINYGEILKATVGVDDEWGVAYFSRVIGPTLRRHLDGDPPFALKEKSRPSENVVKQKYVNNISLDELLMETEDFLRQLDSGLLVSNLNDFSNHQNEPILPKTLSMFDHFPQSSSDSKWSSPPSPSQTSIIILLQVVFSSVGHVQRPSSKFVALILMHRIALVSTDEIRLQRIVPFVTSLLQDSEPIVRASGITVLTSVLSAVSTFPPSDSAIFPRYIFKKVAHLITDASLIVRVAFAQNIALLAETAQRFLDVGHSVSLYDAVAGIHCRDANDKATAVFSDEATNLLSKNITNTQYIPSMSSNIGTPTPTTMFKSTYDSDLAVLHEVVYRWVVHITTDSSEHSSQSKQVLLRGLPRLCNFFGMEYSFQILPIILAFLNDRKDWQLRAELCKHLPSVCVSVGRAASEQFVVPCIETALSDDVEQVICEALRCLKALVSLSLLTRVSLLGTDFAGPSPVLNGLTRSNRKKQGIIKKCGPLLLHPSNIVRKNAASLIVLVWQILGDTDLEVVFSRLLKPYLQFKPTFESIPHMCACAKVPLLQKSETTMNTKLPDFPMKPHDSIEVSSKLSHNLSVPSQMSAELASKRNIEWYETLLRAASESPSISAPVFSLGFDSIQDVHSISIDIPNVSSNHANLNDVDGHKSPGNADNSILDRPVVKIAASACRGEWGSTTVMDQLVPGITSLHSTIQSLGIPPLPPNLGYSSRSDSVGIRTRHTWSPKENKLIGSTDATEHTGPVHRLAVSEDQSYFVSAGYDGTSKVFELRQAHDSGGDIHSCLTYEGHRIGNKPSTIRINDVAILEHSHSVATAASDGSLHVWRVDTVQQNQQSRMSRVSGHSALRSVNPGEGELLAVSHFSTPSASIVAFATQQGHIRSLDLRCSREPFSLSVRPELGYLTSMEVGSNKNWIVASTVRGFVGLWDIRFQAMVKLWRDSTNSPIKRLSIASGADDDESSRPLVFIGCGKNEASLFDVSTGECHQCYRVLDSSISYVDEVALPSEYLSMPRLEKVNIPSQFGRRLVSVDKALQQTTRKEAGELRINALLGDINNRGPSYLMTGGSDHMIRYWDLKSPSKSCCVSGLARNQPSPSFERIQTGDNSTLFLCRQPPIHPTSLLESSKLPSRNNQGVIMCDGRHLDSVLDLKVIKNPSLLLSASRDHTIKLWG